LIGYYYEFVKNYGQIATPITKLLKKETFSWIQETNKYFEKIKETMCTFHVLATLDFTKTFIVECDASCHVIGVVLMQERRSLSFEISQIKGKLVQVDIGGHLPLPTGSHPVFILGGCFYIFRS
jgi:hypothetical protein